MAQKLYEETNIQAIANAIRDKNGLTTTYKTSEMAAAIAAIPTGGGGEGIPEELLNITGSAQFKFSYNAWNAFLEHYGNQITTSNITNCESMFNLTTALTKIPFTVNIKSASPELSSMFTYCTGLTECPRVRIDGSIVSTSQSIYFDDMIASCRKLRNVDDLFVPEDLDFIAAYDPATAYVNLKIGGIFEGCYSLRTVPTWFYKMRIDSKTLTTSYTDMSDIFKNCYTLDEVQNLQVWMLPQHKKNLFSNTFQNCYRLKNITFETNEDGSPKVVEWKTQTIDLSSYVGYGSSSSENNMTTSYNSGISKTKRVKDADTYAALKDDPDWYTLLLAYSRYNHDSAVATINSLPDTSAYLATAGGTNTIKFKGDSGSSTDGGAINTLTEEEIAVATAKGWTVTLA